MRKLWLILIAALCGACSILGSSDDEVSEFDATIVASHPLPRYSDMVGSWERIDTMQVDSGEIIVRVSYRFLPDSTGIIASEPISCEHPETRWCDSVYGLLVNFVSDRDSTLFNYDAIPEEVRFQIVNQPDRWCQAIWASGHAASENQPCMDVDVSADSLRIRWTADRYTRWLDPPDLLYEYADGSCWNLNFVLGVTLCEDQDVVFTRAPVDLQLHDAVYVDRNLDTVSISDIDELQSADWYGLLIDGREIRNPRIDEWWRTTLRIHY